MRTYFRLTSFVLALLAATQVAGQTLEARKPFRKPNDRHLTATENATGEIVVKFHDHVRARVSPSGELSFQGNGDVRAARRLLQACSLQPAIKMSPIEIEALQTEAATNSGKAQPDLAGLISVRVADLNDKIGIERLARRLNSLDSVEFATIKHSLKISSNPYGGYCSLPVAPLLCVQVRDLAQCTDLGGVFSRPLARSSQLSKLLARAAWKRKTSGRRISHSKPSTRLFASTPLLRTVSSGGGSSEALMCGPTATRLSIPRYQLATAMGSHNPMRFFLLTMKLSSAWLVLNWHFPAMTLHESHANFLIPLISRPLTVRLFTKP